MKLKKSSMDEVTEEAKSIGGGGAFISARLRNPADEIAAQSTGTSDTIGGICAIVATVMMLVITVLLYMNWEAIKSA